MSEPILPEGEPSRLAPVLGGAAAQHTRIKVYDRPGGLAALSARTQALILGAALALLISSFLLYRYAV